MGKTIIDYDGLENSQTYSIYLDYFATMVTEKFVNATSLRDAVEDDISENTGSWRVERYALEFIEGVNWQEIADKINSNNSLNEE
tara:strand:+ start:170 stop:424 length:255 start_codon:yes stop_codon:yes gene_type:complete